MVEVRQRADAVCSPDKNPALWPPKSPFQALLSSPSGRKKWRDQQNGAVQRSPSPSPARKSTSSSRKLQELAGMAGAGSEDEDEEEDDEETLKLRLQEIQAKLRLKRMQNARKAESVVSAESSSHRTLPRALSPTMPTSPQRSTLAAGVDVEVPLSPVRRQRPLQEQLSPARVKLGLNAASRAEHVSLKRARDGSQIQRSDYQRRAIAPEDDASQRGRKSFSERLVERSKTANHVEARRDLLQSVRSSGFQKASKPTTASARGKRGLNEPQAASNARDIDPSASTTRTRHPPKSSGAAPEHESTAISSQAFPAENGEGTSGYDPFSEIHLSKRRIQHSLVAREMAGKEIYTLPRLLREVKSPHYEPPDCEADYIVFAILASKSNPFDQATVHKQVESHGKDSLQAPTNKFMVLHLCDLQWELDLFLFGTAFNQFWKLTPGTLLAIMNPAIMPPKGSQHNGQFSLKLGSSEDAIMEIGTARDLGWCVSIKRDGKQCESWVDKRKTEACEFHVSLQIDKSRQGRMEVNTMWRGTGPASERPERRIKNKDTGQNGAKNRSFDREHGMAYAINTGMGKSSATLIDADDMDTLHTMTQEEASRKRLATAQKERDLARKLGEMGKGVGAEYLRANQNSTKGTATSADGVNRPFFDKPSASELGLLANKAGNARLSPAKDRKRHFGLGIQSKTVGRDAEAMGWGGARKAGLLQPKENRLGSPERGQTRLDSIRAKVQADAAGMNDQAAVLGRLPDEGRRSASPSKKRARFALEKGIRMPGRESLPGETGLASGTNGVASDDNDDDLDII